MTTAQRPRIRTKDTSCERTMAIILDHAGIGYSAQVRLPGKPDFRVRGTNVVIFVDGDFWHGFNFSSWRWRLSEKWRSNISQNIKYDRQVDRRLRASGWKVLRVWEHELQSNPKAVLLRVTAALG